MSKKYCAIIQGRMGASRLPGKVLMEVLDKPLLAYLIERVKKSKMLDSYIIATTEADEDIAIADYCQARDVPFMRGSEHDVLKRYYDAAILSRAENIVRITADCPIIDPNLIDQVISAHQQTGCDYTTNAINSSYPDGMDVEVFTFKSLERAYNEAKLTSEREHVTPFMHTNPEEFTLGYVKEDADNSHIRVTVDHVEDFELVKAIIEMLYPKNPLFGLGDILKLLHENPELMEINAKYTRNEGYEKSKNEDTFV